MPIIFSPPQPINTAEPKKGKLPMQGQNTHNHEWNMVKGRIPAPQLSGLCLLTIQSPWKHHLYRLGQWTAKNCSDCSHPSLLVQTFKNSCNISSGLIELCAISGLPVSGNSPHPPYLCVNVFFALLFMFFSWKSVCKFPLTPHSCLLLYKM